MQHFRPRRIAKKHRLPGLAKLRHHIRVHIQRDIGQALGIQQAAQALPDPAIAGEDDMAFRTGQASQARRALAPRLNTFQPARQAAPQAGQKRRGHHRQTGDQQHELRHIRRHQTKTLCQRHHHKGEFAGLAKQQGQFRRHRPAKPE